MTKGLGKILHVSKLLYVKLQKIYKVNKCCALFKQWVKMHGNKNLLIRFSKDLEKTHPKHVGLSVHVEKTSSTHMHFCSVSGI